MKTLKININGKKYRMFIITVFKGTENQQTIIAAEEKLNQLMQTTAEQDRKEEISYVDQMYDYWVPQEIADDYIESEIIDSIESVMREDLHKECMPKFICSECGSADVEICAWVNANTNEVGDACDDNDAWCNECQSNVRLKIAK